VFFPIGDTPNPRFTPWVNWALIAINVVVFVAFTIPLSAQPADLMTAYDAFVLDHGYKPGAPSLRDLFSAMFLHAGLTHLFGNMLFLWIYGDNVEHRLGRLRYLLVYLLTGAAATLGFAALAGDSMTPLIGASGPISGVLGLYFVFFPRNRVKVFIFLFPFIMRVFFIPARIVLGLYLVLDNLLPLLVSGVGGGIAHGAHIGGFVAGLVLGVSALRLRIPSPWPGSAPEEGTASLRAALRGGGEEPVLAALRGTAPEQLAELTSIELSELADVLVRADQTEAGIRFLRRALRVHHRHPGLHLTLGLLWAARGQEATAYQHLVAAVELNPSGDAGQLALRALRQLNLSTPR
jgi:membrane associated rhomboid family serine protease